jgi:hypothetical protein
MAPPRYGWRVLVDPERDEVSVVLRNVQDELNSPFIIRDTGVDVYSSICSR